ncbi:unnamed protein product [Closterium sp. NIES-64]|nr:unnamed protein product [Closterium sp. NIES-64]
MAARIASNLRELLTPSVRQAAKAALGGVSTTTLLTRAVAGAEDVGARAKTPTTLTLRVPLTELLRRGDVPRTLLLLLLLVLTTPGAAPLRSTTSTSSTSSTTAASTSVATAASAPTATATAASASAAATATSTPGTTPTATPTPPAAPTATSTTSASPTRALASLALARVASPARGRRRTDRLKTNEVGRSSRGDRGQQGGRGTPLKDGGARVTTRGSYSEYALLRC